MVGSQEVDGLFGPAMAGGEDNLMTQDGDNGHTVEMLENLAV